MNETVGQPYRYVFVTRSVPTEEKIRALMQPLLPLPIKRVEINGCEDFAWVYVRDSDAHWWVEWCTLGGEFFFRWWKAGEAMNTSRWIGDNPHAH